MSEGNRKGDGYEVGYGKPPRHTQFVPGQSGNKGRKRKKKPETQAEIIKRIRDQPLEVGGKTVTMFEFAVARTYSETIKSGKPRDLKLLFELLDKYGAIPDVDRQAENEQHAQEAMDRITNVINRTYNRDPKDIAFKDQESKAEAELIMGCSHCGPALRERWRAPAYKALLKSTIGGTSLHNLVMRVREGKPLFGV